jgi:hypothetical protein
MIQAAAVARSRSAFLLFAIRIGTDLLAVPALTGSVGYAWQN